MWKSSLSGVATRIAIPFTVALAVLPGEAMPQQRSTIDERLDRFKLFHGCEPMELVVEGLHPGAATIGLTEERIQTLAESRLRAARLFSEDADTYLYVRVNVPGRAFSMDLAYNKRLYDASSDEWFHAPTWRNGSTGTHGGDAGYILQGVSEHIDDFLLQYLRVNEAAC